MTRSRGAWLAFGACMALMLTGIGWGGAALLDADRRAALDAALRERTRIALWRSDTALAAIVAEENARPHFFYQPFIAPAGAAPSPLLLERPEASLLHFEIGPDGAARSPQAPTGDQRDRALALGIDATAIDSAAARLASLPLESLAAPAPARHEQAEGALAQAPADPDGFRRSAERAGADLDERQERSRLNRDLQDRALALQQQNALSLTRSEWPFAEDAGEGAMSVTAMRAAWVEGSLFLLREVVTGAGRVTQGVWLDDAHIRDSLRAGVEDLLPEARFDPIVGDHRGAALAALPLALVPGPIDPPPGSARLRRAVFAAWGLALTGAIGAGLLLRAALVFGERRAAFVATVTHELRSPLTSLRLYSDLLADDAIADEGKRRGAVRSMQQEASRLARLLENVLAYARLERNGRAPALAVTTVGDLLERAEPALRLRAEQAGMALVIDAADGSRGQRCLAESAGVEQALFNLVDNACKYARAGTPAEVTLGARVEPGVVRLSVRDHGPGVARRDARHLFRPFERAGAHGAEGVGLGLALSRRLARRMGGDLRLTSGDGGACFELTLRRAR